MPFAEHHDMIKAVPSDRTDEPLCTSVLPWRPWRNRPIAYSQGSKTPDENLAIDAIPIANDVSRRVLPAICLGELAGNPFSVRMRGHIQPQKLAAAMVQDQKSIQQPK